MMPTGMTILQTCGTNMYGDHSMIEFMIQWCQRRWRRSYRPVGRTWLQYWEEFPAWEKCYDFDSGKDLRSKDETCMFYKEYSWKIFEEWKEKECLVKMSWRVALLEEFFLKSLFMTNFFHYLHFSGALLGTANAAENCSFPEKIVLKTLKKLGKKKEECFRFEN